MKYATRSQTSNTEPIMVKSTFDCTFCISASLKYCKISTKKAKVKTEIAILKTFFLMKIFKKQYRSTITKTSPKKPLIK